MRLLVALSSLLWIAPATAQSLGEKALAATFYESAALSTVELLNQMRVDLLAAMSGPLDHRVVIERSLGDSFSEQALKRNAAKALEKSMPRAEIERALKKITPEVQAMLREGTAKNTAQGKPQDLLWEALKLPDAPAREVQISRIVPHIPNAASFRELAGTVIELLADVVLVSSGTDSKRKELRKTYWTAVEPAIAVMQQENGPLQSGLIAYRKRSLAELKLLADALSSPEGAALQAAAAKAMIAGASVARKDAVEQLKRDLALAFKP